MLREGDNAKKGKKLYLNYIDRLERKDDVFLRYSFSTEDDMYLLTCEDNTVNCSVIKMKVSDYIDRFAIEDDGESLSHAMPFMGDPARIAKKFKPQSLIPRLKAHANLGDCVNALGEYKGILKPWDIADLCPDSICISSFLGGLGSIKTSDGIFRSMIRLAVTQEDYMYVADYLERIVKDDGHMSGEWGPSACSKKNQALNLLSSMNDPYARTVTGRVAFSPHLPDCVHETAAKLQQELQSNAFIR